MRSYGKPCAKKKMRRSASLVSERKASSEVESSDSATTGPSRSFSSRTVNRLSGLLNRIRRSHYDERKKEFNTVRQKNGGGNRFISYTDEEPLKLETLTDRVGTCIVLP